VGPYMKRDNNLLRNIQIYQWQAHPMLILLE
jgi:hypothetical protein